MAQPGKDYTVYVYDYSEYETSLVGQGMLSWVLASSSPIPEVSAHLAKTLVTGRVCKNARGLFSKGAQETLEVKLRLVPISSVMHSGCLDNMHNYRRLSNPIQGDVDAQSRTNFVRQNSVLLEFRTSSPVSQHSRVIHSKQRTQLRDPPPKNSAIRLADHPIRRKHRLLLATL